MPTTSQLEPEPNGLVTWNVQALMHMHLHMNMDMHTNPEAAHVISTSILAHLCGFLCFITGILTKEAYCN